MNRAEFILKELNITEEVLSIFPYGSRIYSNHTEQSDYDYIIVTKSAMLKSGAFRQNAISSKDYKIQGVLYSRGGFIDAINNYEIGALECLSLDPLSQVILNTWPFKVQKWNEREMVKKIIQKASASWHIAEMQSKNRDVEDSKVGLYHALRILMFGLQLKEHKKIVDFKVANELKNEFNLIDEEKFDTRDYIKLRDELMIKLRK